MYKLLFDLDSSASRVIFVECFIWLLSSRTKTSPGFCSGSIRPLVPAWVVGPRPLSAWNRPPNDSPATYGPSGTMTATGSGSLGPEERNYFLRFTLNKIMAGSRRETLSRL